MNNSQKSAGLLNIPVRYPRTILALSLLFSVIALLYTRNSLEFLTGRDDLMPRNAPFQKDYRAYREEFGDQEEIVVVIEGEDASLVASFGDALHARLLADKTSFRDVFYPGGLEYFRKNGLLFMPLEDIKKLRHTLSMAAPVLRDLASSPSIQTLFTSLSSQIDSYLKNSEPSSLQRLSFMLRILDRGFSSFDGKNSALSMDSFLSGGGDGNPSMMERAGRQQVITLLPVKEAGSFVPAEKAIIKVRSELKTLLEKPEFKGIRSGLTGVPVLEYEEMATSQRDMETATVLSIILTVLLLVVSFRGILNVIAAMVSLIVALSLSFGFATLAVGHLNILSMAFAVMLIGLGIEYGIQVVLRYQEELSKGTAPLESIGTACRMTVWSVIMAAATVALAFATFVFTDFKGISELGIIAAGGIVICVISSFTVLPAMLALLAPWRKPVRRQGHAVSRSLDTIFSRPWRVICAALAVSALCMLPASRLGFDYNMMNLQAKGLESVDYAYRLMKSRENAGYFGVAVAGDREEAEKITRRLEALPSVDHVVSIGSLVPDRQTEKLAELSAARAVMADVKPAPYREDLKLMELPAVFEGFRERVEKLVLKLESGKSEEAPSMRAFLTTLDKFFSGLEKEKDRNALGMLREFQGAMFSQLPAKLEMLKNSLDAGQISAEDIPDQLKSRFVGKSGKLLLQIAPKKEIFEQEPLAEFVSQIRSVVPDATGEPVSVYESLKILKESYVSAFGYAFSGIVVILLIAFRSVRFALLGTAPLATGLLFMAGGMSLLNLKFNVANIIVMPLLLGVGIDSAIYIISRYRAEGGTPVDVLRSSAGVGVFLNALTILFSFGALMVARHQGVYSIGAVMSLGMTAVVASFLIFLPALLMVFGGKESVRGR